MSDDLISRKAFMEYLGLEDTEENREENVGEIVTLEDFDRQPTAFDKEKVIKELEYDKEMSAKYSTGLREQGHIEAFDEAISIVKKGGINNILL